jgi:dienelactone hydrolase
MQAEETCDIYINLRFFNYYYVKFYSILNVINDLARSQINHRKGFTYMKKLQNRFPAIFLSIIILFTSVFPSVPTIAATAYEVSYSTLSDWGSGFVGEITIKNTGDKEIDQWKLEFDWDKEITSIWNAKIISHESKHYVVAFEQWNTIIPIGKSLTFGFLGSTGKVTAEPSNYKLTDIYGELAQKDKEWQDYVAAREAEEFQKSPMDFAAYFGSRFESLQPFTIGYSIIDKNPVSAYIDDKYENVRIPTKDGLILKGMFFPVKNPKGTIIALHGRNSYACENLPPLEYLIHAGYQVLIYNARVWNYYSNPKEYVGDVRKDIDDVGCAIDYLKTRCDVNKGKIGVFGGSYGASKAIISGSKYTDLKVVVSDAAMAYIGDIYGMQRDDVWKAWMKKYLNIPEGQNFSKDDYNSIDYTSAIKDIHVPILILHGLKDDVVPVGLANLLFENANDPKEIYFMPNSGHVNWFLTQDKAEYQSTVLNFLEKYLK